MDFKKILNIVHEADPEVFEKISPRRHVLKSFSSKVAVAALPFALGSLFKKAYGKNTDILYESLSLLLTFEYMEAEYYRIASNVLYKYPTDAHGGIKKLAEDEKKHVKFLSDFLTTAAGMTPVVPNFDFSGAYGAGDGPFSNVFENYTEFLKLAQIIEDTAVRAFKGQLPRLVTNVQLVEYAIRLHSIEAKHAAYVRIQRRKMGVETKPWVSFTNSDIVTQQNNFVQHTYKGESLATQGSRQLVNINGYTVTEAQVTEAFDEPLGEADLKIIMEPFIIS